MGADKIAQHPIFVQVQPHLENKRRLWTFRDLTLFLMGLYAHLFIHSFIHSFIRDKHLLNACYVTGSLIGVGSQP